MHLPLHGVLFVLLFYNVSGFANPIPAQANFTQLNYYLMSDSFDMLKVYQSRSPEPDLPRRRQGGGTR